MKKISLRSTAVAAAALAASSAFATDGYFPHGYGMKALGMGGASVAMTDNAFAGANNPATAAFSGGRIDLGATLFMPKRGASRTGAGAMDGSIESDKSSFLIPEFGYVRQLSGDTAVGLTVYGNGGMNTDYKGAGTDCSGGGGGNDMNFLCGMGRLGVNLEQLVIAPVYAKKINETTSFGLSPLLVYQTFEAKGLEGFTSWANINRNPMVPATGLTGNGKDTSTGVGIRVGFYTKLDAKTDLGVSYSPKVNMSRFDKYNQLFADRGDFDIPANFTVGIASQVTPAVKLAVDYQQINYSGVNSVGNPQAQPTSAVLGDSSGSGFGWRNAKVVKIGAEWKFNEQLTLRAGYNHTNNPVTSPNVTFNIIAPGVITNHYTVGATMNVDKNSEVTFAYMYAPKVTLSGPSGLAGTDTIHMSQQSLGAQYSWKF
jgi:long-chain fatty acid transport protein